MQERVLLGELPTQDADLLARLNDYFEHLDYRLRQSLHDGRHESHLLEQHLFHAAEHHVDHHGEGAGLRDRL